MKFLYCAIIFFSLFISNLTKAQSYLYEIGLGGGGIWQDKNLGTYSQETNSVVYGNIIYYPKLNFLEANNFSLSIGTPLRIGFGSFTTSNSYDINNNPINDGGLVFAYDLPIALDLNLGGLATKESTWRLGGYLGAGYGYNSASLFASHQSNYRFDSHGILYRGGIRYSTRNNTAYTFGFQLKNGSEAKHNTTFEFDMLIPVYAIIN